MPINWLYHVPTVAYFRPIFEVGLSQGHSFWMGAGQNELGNRLEVRRPLVGIPRRETQLVGNSLENDCIDMNSGQKMVPQIFLTKPLT